MTAAAVGARFLESWAGDARAESPPVLGATVLELHRLAAQRWPTVSLEPERFAAHLGERTPPDGTASAGLARLRTDELYLTLGCLERDPAALACFEASYIEKVPRFIARLRPGPAQVDEVRQTLREKLLGAAGPAKLTQFSGRGSLEGWFRVAALRTALNLTAQEVARSGDELLEEKVLAGEELRRSDPELDFIKARYRTDVSRAFQRALAALDRDARTLLRLCYVEGMPHGAIARLHDVHRTTILRRIASAQETLVALVRAELSSALRLSPEECEGLIDLVKSRLEVSVGTLLGRD